LKILLRKNEETEKTLEEDQKWFINEAKKEKDEVLKG